MDFKDQIRIVVEKHISSIHTDFEVLEKATQPPGNIYDSHQAAHKLKGSSGSIGFQEISLLAQKLEKELNQLRNDPSATIPSHMAQDIEQLRVLVAAMKPENSKLLAKYNE